MNSLRISESIPDLAVAVVEARGLRIEASTQPVSDYCQRITRSVAEHGMMGGDIRKRAIRDLLRTGGYKPAGRGKPAQEYLWQTAQRDGVLPSIYSAVDLINVVSLCSGLPVSLLSLARVGTQLAVRYGKPGESYVFNSAEQLLDVGGLICVCGGEPGQDLPLGSPVKDSLRAKVVPGDHDVAAIIYGSTRTVSLDELGHWANELAQRFRRWCGATEATVSTVVSE